jgi:hypothetical protein
LDTLQLHDLKLEVCKEFRIAPGTGLAPVHRMRTPRKTVGWIDAEARRGPANRPRRILVVDDNRATLETMAELLRGSGYEVQYRA